ncbi:hypothetical protein HOK40_01175 [Candidatus Peregrinibacteria bacterium]|jgi:hypothetical protein|nr:hypothetical protein [Candidatus Peregrinibacteria bacterium]MBT7337325.1 hypothetical protein [Candidatus Peregrinibacteria bacterium]
MNRNTHKHRLGLYLYVVALLSTALPQQTFAATMDANFEFYPHCDLRTTEGDDDDLWALGPIPSPGIVANTGGGRGGITCTDFEIHDPQTLKTRPLREGDILDIDVVIDNPSKQEIARARAWLSYDPDVLQGNSIDIHSAFPVVTPGENAFSDNEGYAKMGASADGGGSESKKVMFARIQFTVLDTSVGKTPITFHDPQIDGHTVIMAKDGSDDSYILEDDPGVLLVVFAEDDSVEEEVSDDNDASDVNPFDDLPMPENACISNSDCNSDLCISGSCAEPDTKVPNGDSCITDNQCESGLCGSGICIPSLSDEPETMEVPVDNTPDTPETPAPAQQNNTARTAFSLLQIQNVRATTDGSAIFLSWNPLNSNQMKAYNIYYGTTSGRYIQRKTIDKSENTITIRSLSIGTQYYLAVRALSSGNEESAFSKEVSIVVGSPDSSSAPLVLGSVLGSNAPRNPIDPGETPVMPGETGIPSLLLLAVIIAAIIGTGFASKRQFAVTPFNPHV